jgi:hypothetical protein
MINQRHQEAIVFPADAKDRTSTNVHQSRFAGVAKAFGAAGIEVVGVPYADAFAKKIRAELLKVNGVLVWVNPDTVRTRQVGSKCIVSGCLIKGRVCQRPS